MNKDFVPYDIALDLKNLGFDEECYGHSYTEMEEDFHLDMLPLMKNSKWESVDAISIPMRHQALRWFREKHGLVGNIHSIYLDETHTSMEYWFWIGCCDNEYNDDDEDVYYGTYDESELECIKKLINIVKKK